VVTVVLAEMVATGADHLLITLAAELLKRLTTADYRFLILILTALKKAVAMIPGTAGLKNL